MPTAEKKMVLGAFLPEYKPGKFPFFVAKLSCERHDSTNFAEKFIHQNILAYHTPRTIGRFALDLVAAFLRIGWLDCAENASEAGQGGRRLMAKTKANMEKVAWSGRLLAIQPRIRLTRSFACDYPELLIKCNLV